MVVAKLHFLQIQRESPFGDAVALDQTLLGKTPKTLNAVNIYFADGESFAVVHLQMPVTRKHEGIVAFVPVGIDQGPAAHHLVPIFTPLTAETRHP
jgi:hypothetical protein